MKSVLQANKECWLCGRTDSLHDHHCIHGKGNRQKSEKYGLKIWLCPMHHNMSREGVHQNRAFDLRVKQMAQSYFETNVGDRELFIREFGKSYL